MRNGLNSIVPRSVLPGSGSSLANPLTRTRHLWSRRMSRGLLASCRNRSKYGITRALTRAVSIVCVDSPAQLMYFLFPYLVEKQTIWDFSPAKPEDYVSLGSYFQSVQGSRAGPPPSFKTEPLKHLRAVRKEFVVEATLGENTVSLCNVYSTRRRP